MLKTSARLIFIVCASACLASLPARAIISQPEALRDSGAFKVNVDIEIGEGMAVLKTAALQHHAEDYLQAAGVAVIQDEQTGDAPSVVTPQERRAPELYITVAMRPLADPPGHVASIVVSHLQAAVLHPRNVAVQGLGWQENWASVIPEGGDTAPAVNTMLDHILDDFAKDYLTANLPATH